jgi:hypothetical protein
MRGGYGRNRSLVARASRSCWCARAAPTALRLDQKDQGSMLHVAERFDSIDWFYHVGYGERESL